MVIGSRCVHGYTLTTGSERWLLVKSLRLKVASGNFQQPAVNVVSNEGLTKLGESHCKGVTNELNCCNMDTCFLVHKIGQYQSHTKNSAKA